jgi:hypothetical protein
MLLARLAVLWFCGGLDVNLQRFVGDVLRGSHNRLGRFTGSRGRRLDKSIAIHHYHIYIGIYKGHEALHLQCKEDTKSHCSMGCRLANN